MKDCSNFEYSSSQVNLITSRTFKVVTLDDYIADIDYDMDSDDDELVSRYKEVYDSALEFKNKLLEFWIFGTNVLVENNHNTFIPVNKEHIFEYID